MFPTFLPVLMITRWCFKNQSSVGLYSRFSFLSPEAHRLVDYQIIRNSCLIIESPFNLSSSVTFFHCWWHPVYLSSSTPSHKSSIECWLVFDPWSSWVATGSYKHGPTQIIWMANGDQGSRRTCHANGTKARLNRSYCSWCIQEDKWIQAGQTHE